MASGSISRREHFPRNDESRSVWAKVLEEIAKAIQCKQSSCGDPVKPKTDDAEKDGQHSETTDLNRFATNDIDRGHRYPVAGDQTSDREN